MSDDFTTVILMGRHNKDDDINFVWNETMNNFES